MNSVLVMDRGISTFASKALRAEAAGAVAAVIIQTHDVWPYMMEDSKGEAKAAGGLGIPVCMVSKENGVWVMDFCFACDHEVEGHQIPVVDDFACGHAEDGFRCWGGKVEQGRQGRVLGIFWLQLMPEFHSRGHAVKMFRGEQDTGWCALLVFSYCAKELSTPHSSRIFQMLLRDG